MEDPGKTPEPKQTLTSLVIVIPLDHDGGMGRLAFSNSSVLMSNMRSLEISVQEMVHINFEHLVVLTSEYMKMPLVLFIYHKNFATLQKYNPLNCSLVKYAHLSTGYTIQTLWSSY